MFHHVKKLPFNARVSGPDPRFGKLLLEQFGGPNGELKAAMQYFMQAFGARQPYPDKYDMLMDIAAESRAKIVYEYPQQFTDDPLVQESLKFLMTREVSHFQMFAAALESISPNFPPGMLQGDPRFTHKYFNMSKDSGDARGPWNEGQGPWPRGEEWIYVDDPLPHVEDTRGLIDEPVEGTNKSAAQIDEMNEELARIRSQEIEATVPAGANQWSTY